MSTTPPATMKNEFNCLVCCANTTGGVISDECEKNLLFNFLCGMLNVELPEECSWNFSRDPFPLCLRCSCVIQDMFQIQMLADSVELEVLEKAEKMKQTIFDCVQLRKKQILKITAKKTKTTDSSKTQRDFQEQDTRFEFFRNLVILKNFNQLKNTLNSSTKISVKPQEHWISDLNGALSSNFDFDDLLTLVDENSEDITLTNQDLTILSETLFTDSEVVNVLENEPEIDVSSSTEGDFTHLDSLMQSPQNNSIEDVPINIMNSADEIDTILGSPWPSWEDWENFSSLPISIVKPKDTNEITNSKSDEYALYQALISEKCHVDIEPLLEKANLPSCSYSFEENSEPIKKTAENSNSEGLTKIMLEENVSNPSSNDSSEVITITDDSQGSEDDGCTIIEQNNNNQRKKSKGKARMKYPKDSKQHIVLTTHSIITNANNREGSTNIVIEQKTPLQVRSGLFMTVNGSPDTWQCILCGKIVRNFKNHKAVHFPGQFQCNICPAVFKRRDNLAAHYKAKH